MNRIAERDRIVISISLVVIVTLAWAYLIHLGRQMSSSMADDTMMADMGMSWGMPWTATDIMFTFVMWTVMMVGMMAGTAAPVLLLFARSRREREARGVPFTVLAFGLGYVTVWAGFSACATIAQWGLHRAALLSPAMAATNPRLAGTILIAAGIYQLTPWKSACLAHCRSPLGFLMTRGRDGTWGAFHMGVHHGAYCVGCCWALMGVLFVVGVMNLLWVAALSGFVLLEKTGPAGMMVARIGGAGMVACGILAVV